MTFFYLTTIPSQLQSTFPNLTDFIRSFYSGPHVSHSGLFLMKNAFQYSHFAIGVLYTRDRGSGRELSRGVRLVMIFAVLLYLKLKGRWESAPVNGVK